MPRGIYAPIFIALALSAVFYAPVFASSTNGTIDSSFKYAWGDRMGWLNFATTGGNIQITDTTLTGYIWSDNAGWINLAPAGSGVTNNNEGTLSGSAWSESIGYINFGSVVINSSGKFTGSASGTVAGTITFDCTNCDVRTDWRPASTRGGGSSPSPTPSPSPSSGGGGPSAESLTPPRQPLVVIINNGRLYTSSPLVSLLLFAGQDVTKMAVSNIPDLSDVSQEAFTTNRLWDLCSRGGVSLGGCAEGPYTVYVKYFTQWGQSAIVSSTVIYQRSITPVQATETVPPLVAIGPTAPSSVSQTLRDILNALIPGFLRPKGEPPSPSPTAIFIPQISQLVFGNVWNLLPVEAIHEFVFAPLPQEIAFFEAKFPSFRKTFQDVGIVRQSDVQKLLHVTLLAPSLGEVVGLVKPGTFSLPNTVPFALLSEEAKQRLPSDALFVQVIGEKLDLNVNVGLTDTGTLEPYINTIVGAPLHLTVKPEGNPSSVRGYLIFDSRTRGNKKRVSELPKTLGLNMYRSMPQGQLAAVSEIMYQNAFGGKVDAPTGNRLALLEFEYTDADGDGIYTADIVAPVVDGTYEVITRVSYVMGDSIVTKELKLIAVIDPEGYIYDTAGGRQTRIPDAQVTLYWKDPSKKEFVSWPAQDFNQVNPQVTDERGTYAFLSPEGSYYLAVDAPGYSSYRGEPFSLIKGSSGVHLNIELQPKWGMLSRVDWKTLLLIIVILLLGYNFYRDRMRMKMVQG